MLYLTAHSTYFICGYMASDSVMCYPVCDMMHIKEPMLLIGRKEERKKIFYLMTHSTHFIYGYMTTDIW